MVRNNTVLFRPNVKTISASWPNYPKMFCSYAELTLTSPSVAIMHSRWVFCLLHKNCSRFFHQHCCPKKTFLANECQSLLDYTQGLAIEYTLRSSSSWEFVFRRPPLDSWTPQVEELLYESSALKIVVLSGYFLNADEQTLGLFCN